MSSQQHIRSCRYLIVGDGRSARHFAYYFQQWGVDYRQWSRKANGPLSSATLKSMDRILLLISDGAIAPFLQQYPALQEKVVVHCSGSLILPHVFSAHPLTSFSSELFQSDFYPKIPFFIEAEGPDFSELLPGLPNPWWRIPRELKPLYHSLCVLSGNFTVLLWQKFFTELSKQFNVPMEFALPYLEAVLYNLQSNPMYALTGPLVRGDNETVAKNVAALGADPYADVYRAFVTAYQKERT